MRRFPTSRQLDRLVARSKLLPAHIDSLAVTIAQFHIGLPAAETASQFGTAAATHAAVSKSFEQLQAALAGGEDETSIVALHQALQAEYDKCKYRLEQRHMRGFIRECHGDLHLGNIALIRNQPTPFDCIEFNPALRWIDVMNEVAFTVMDLLHYQRPELAFRFLNAYLELLEIIAPSRCCDIMLPIVQLCAPWSAPFARDRRAWANGRGTEAMAHCRDFVALAAQRLAWDWPALIITHGLPGSGKTTFSQVALERLQAIRIRSDVERKAFIWTRAAARTAARLRAHLHCRRDAQTYVRLHELARELLTAGIAVIVDAAFLRRNEREFSVAGA